MIHNAVNARVTTLGSTASTDLDFGQSTSPPGYWVKLVRISPTTQKLSATLCIQGATGFNHSTFCSATVPAHGNCAAQAMTVTGFPFTGP
jgi:hypothetical protein